MTPGHEIPLTREAWRGDDRGGGEEALWRSARLDFRVDVGSNPALAALTGITPVQARALAAALGSRPGT